MARASLESTRQIDITSVLSSVQAPTLVLHCREDFTSVDAGRYLSTHVPNASFVELSGADHVPFSGNMAEDLVAAIRHFIAARTALPESTGHNFGAILFTDVVNSTRQVLRVGDVEWRELLTKLDLAVRDVIDAFAGDLVKSTGDGHLVTFDSADNAVRCGDRLIRSAEGLGIELRVGVHAGSYEQLGQDVIGLAVHAASRLLDHAQPGEVLVSSAVQELVVGSGLSFSKRGSLPLKGLDEPCDAYGLIRVSVDAPRPPDWTGGRSETLSRPDRMLLAFSKYAPTVARALTRVLNRPSEGVE